jgi:uncharacterized protein
MKTPPVRYLVLWLTTACNLRCQYCYRHPEAPKAMPRDIALAALSLAAASSLPFHVQLAGGEPTLQPGLIEFVGRTVREAGWPATVAVQTNGTLIDAALIDLCRRYDIGMGISVDGPPDIQEQLRGRAGDIFRGLALLAQAAVSVRVTAVLSSVNAVRLYDLAVTLSRFANVRGLGLDPLVRTGTALSTPDLFPQADTIRSGVRAMCEAVEQMNKCHGRRIEWREMEAVRRALSGQGISRPYCHACKGESLAVHPSGAVYPCGQTIGDPHMAAGTVDSVDWERLRTCYQGLQLRGDCTTCPLAGRCPGDCPSRLHYNNGSGTPAMCIVYQAIAEMLTGKPAGRNMP